MSYVGYIVLTLAALMIFLQVFAYYSAKKSEGQPAPKFDKLNCHNNRQLLYFYNTRCSACKAITPIIQALQKEHAEVTMVDTHQDPDIARSYNVRGTPTIVAVNNNTITKVLIGAQSEKKIRTLLED